MDRPQGRGADGYDISQRRIHNSFVESLINDSSERIEWSLENKVNIRAFCALHRLDKKSADNDALLRELVRALDLGGYDPFVVPGDWPCIRKKLLNAIKYRLDRWTREGTLQRYFDAGVGATRLHWPEGLRNAWINVAWQGRGRSGMAGRARLDEDRDVVMADAEDAARLRQEINQRAPGHQSPPAPRQQPLHGQQQAMGQRTPSPVQHPGSGSRPDRPQVPADLAADLLRAELAALPITPRNIVENDSSSGSDSSSSASSTEDGSTSDGSQGGPRNKLRARRCQLETAIGDIVQNLERLRLTFQQPPAPQGSVKPDQNPAPALSASRDQQRRARGAGIPKLTAQTSRSPPLGIPATPGIATAPLPDARVLVPPPRLQAAYPGDDPAAYAGAKERTASPPALPEARDPALFPRLADPVSLVLARIREVELRAWGFAIGAAGTTRAETARQVCGVLASMREGVLQARRDAVQGLAGGDRGAGIALGVGDGVVDGGVSVALRGLP